MTTAIETSVKHLRLQLVYLLLMTDVQSTAYV